MATHNLPGVPLEIVSSPAARLARAATPARMSTMEIEVARYRLLGRIAAGGMGSVYLGVSRDDEHASRLYAIKVIHESLAEHPVFVDMLLAEAEMARNLVHPNIVGICDSGAMEGRHYVVMPYVEGGTLAELAHRSSGLVPTGIAVRVMIDVLRGLHAAHALTDDDGNAFGLVHRDVSPGNILIGTDGIARVIDFGVAKATTRIPRTMPGIVKGKFAYMAPEQALGESIDCRADVFSAGVVLWSALTGKPLFTGQSDAHTLKNVLDAEVPPPSRVRSDLPPCFDDICDRALQRDPERRFQSAGEFAEVLFTAAKRCGLVASAQEVSDRVIVSFYERIERRLDFVARLCGDGGRDGPVEPAYDLAHTDPMFAVSPELTPAGRTLLRRVERPSLITRVEAMQKSNIFAVSLPQLNHSPRARRAKTTGTLAIVAIAAAAILAAVLVLLRSDRDAAAGSASMSQKAPAVRAPAPGERAGQAPDRPAPPARK